MPLRTYPSWFPKIYVLCNHVDSSPSVILIYMEILLVSIIHFMVHMD